MPDHVHLILHSGTSGRTAADCRPYAAVERHPADEADHQHASGHLSLAEGFYDHVIRNDEDLANVRQYIRNNPLKWIQDKD